MKTIKDKHQALGFRVPPGYFESSKKEMMDRILVSAPTKVRHLTLSKTWAVAAALALLFTGAFMNQWLTSTSSQPVNTHEMLMIESITVEDEAFEDWFEENYVLESI